MKRIIILIFSCLPLFYACKNTTTAPGSANYKTMKVELGNYSLQTMYTAKLRGKQFVDIRPQVSGVITQICINEGDPVKKGQTLFVIDQVPYISALNVAIANVKSAQAKLSSANLLFKSKEELFKAKVVSEYDLSTARNSMAEAEAALAQMKAQEINARNSLSYTEVKSPVDGVAGMIPYRVGSLVSSSIAEPLVSVSDNSSMYAYFSMSENQILDLVQDYGSLQKAIGELPEVELILSNGKTYPNKGHIDAISGSFDQSTGSIRLRASFGNPNQYLRDGASGSLRIPSIYKDCIVIPLSATYEIQNQVYVYKVVDGKAKSSLVEVYKLNNGSQYIVESGLSVGDTIISEGAGLVREGSPVQSKATQE